MISSYFGILGRVYHASCLLCLLDFKIRCNVAIFSIFEVEELGQYFLGEVERGLLFPLACFNIYGMMVWWVVGVMGEHDYGG